MLARTNFLTIRDWHENIIGDKPLVLCYASALEHLGLFGGYMNEKTIDVYATQEGDEENINYYIVETFNDIEIVHLGNTLCASLNQTINDMLANFDDIDEQALVESLARYYYLNGKSFNGITVNDENINRFNSIRNWAIEYYDEV